MAGPQTPSRYTVISTDTHAGADLHDYRAYLPQALHDDFDAWAKGRSYQWWLTSHRGPIAGAAGALGLGVAAVVARRTGRTAAASSPIMGSAPVRSGRSGSPSGAPR